MSLQSALNNQAFQQLPQLWVLIQKCKNGHERGNIEAIAFREITNCYPCLDEMSDDQKSKLDDKIVGIVQYYNSSV